MMKYHLIHSIPGRIRISCDQRLSNPAALIFGAVVESLEGVKNASYNPLTRTLLVVFDEQHRPTLLKALELTTVAELEKMAQDLDLPQTPAEASLFQSVVSLLSGWFFRSLLPLPIRYAITAYRALPYYLQGLDCLAERKVNVELLDATAVTVSLLRGDPGGAGTIMTLLQLGELIESWTRQRSRESLGRSLALQVDSVWRRDPQTGQEELIPVGDVQLGDWIVVRSGSALPVDGRVVQGEGMVNQASLTGEGLPVYKGVGLSAYAGTVLEEGELCIETMALPQSTRLSEIGRLIDENEMLKAETQCRAERLADKVVPFSFLIALGTWLLTGNFTRAASALVVDYSCALKLTTPLTILSAMRQAIDHGAVLKGGKFLEALHEADTLVFDKTGTLTVAEPQVSEVIPFGDWTRDEVLKLAACLEEHFPHSMATAVVRQAEQEGLVHREEHATVEYIIAHGLVSRYRDRRVLIGSAHFIFEDEGVTMTDHQRQVIEQKAECGSLLFLAQEKELIALLVIQDPLRPEAEQIVQQMKKLGFQRLVMLTGDHPRVAARVATKLGIEEFKAEMLPHEKTQMVKQMRQQGCKVVMVGDGVNDSPALAAADLGVSFRTASNVAQEVADLVLTENLTALPEARKLATAAMKRVHRNYAAIVGFNSLLLGLGLFGLLQPTVSALLHNSLTIALSAHSLQNLPLRADKS